MRKRLRPGRTMSSTSLRTFSGNRLTTKPNYSISFYCISIACVYWFMFIRVLVTFKNKNKKKCMCWIILTLNINKYVRILRTSIFGEKQVSYCMFQSDITISSYISLMLLLELIQCLKPAEVTEGYIFHFFGKSLLGFSGILATYNYSKTFEMSKRVEIETLGTWQTYSGLERSYGYTVTACRIYENDYKMRKASNITRQGI